MAFLSGQSEGTDTHECSVPVLQDGKASLGGGEGCMEWTGASELYPYGRSGKFYVTNILQFKKLRWQRKTALLPFRWPPMTPGTLTWLYVCLQLVFLEALLHLQLRSPVASTKLHQCNSRYTQAPVLLPGLPSRSRGTLTTPSEVGYSSTPVTDDQTERFRSEEHFVWGSAAPTQIPAA